MSSATHMPPGQRFGPYTLLAKLATGGMGEIFLARRSGRGGFEKLLVIKRLLPHLAEDEHFVTMFLDEARLAASISHPNVCQVYELDQIDGQYYIAMEYLEGVTLSHILRRARRASEPVDLPLLGTMFHHACEGLHHAHELVDAEGRPVELVHRDVSPSNLFVSLPGMVKILDFGVAKSEQAMAKTRTGSVKGKYAYMSPEQITLKDLDRRSDIFSLGIILFEGLSNRRLFARASEYFVLRAITEDPIPNLMDVRPEVPQALSDITARALARDPEERFSTARALGDAVVEALTPLGGTASNAEVGEYVRDHFANELGERRAVVKVSLRAARMAGEATAEPPEKPTEATAAVGAPPVGVDVDLDDESATRLDRPDDLSEPIPRQDVERKRIWPWIAVPLLLVATAAAAVAASGVLAEEPDAGEPVIVYEGDVETDRGGTPTPGPTTPAATASEADAAPTSPPDARAERRPPTTRPPDQRPSVPQRDPYSTTFARHQRQVADCFQRHAVDVSGTPELAVRLSIAPSGSVKKAALNAPSLADTALGECILRVARSVSFDAQDGPVNVTIPLKVRRRN